MSRETNDIDCSEVLGHLPLFVGGDLEVREAGATDAIRSAERAISSAGTVASAIERHIARCAGCRLEFERAREARGALLGLREQPLADTDLWPEIRAELAAAGLVEAKLADLREPRSLGKPGRIEPGRIEPGRPRRWMPLAAAAGLLACVFGLALLQRSDTAKPGHLDPTDASKVAGVTSDMAPDMASGEGIRDPAAPAAIGRLSADALQRAKPGDERMAHTARPYSEKLRVLRPKGDGPHVLATDNGWR